MADEFIKRGQGNLFVQDDITEPFELLTCTGVADVNKPVGASTPKYDPDIERSGKWVIAGTVEGEADLGSTTLTRPLSSVYNALLSWRCAKPALITYVCEGSRTSPANYMLAFLLMDALPSDSVLESPVAREPGDDERVLTNAPITYQDRIELHNVKLIPIAVTNTAAANGVVFLPELCASDCGTAGRTLCEVGIAGLDGTQYNSEIKVTLDNGVTWTQTAADPFTYDGGNAGKPVFFEISGGERIIVPRISTALGEYAEVSYTEDRGVTWTNVYVGTVSDQFILKLRKYRGKVWAACTGGYIYVSTDMGGTWTAQSAGTATAQQLNDIVMYSDRVGYAVGTNNAFVYTVDGATWAAGTGPAALTNLHSVAVNTLGHVFVGAADGAVYVSTDGGTTWALRRDFGIGIVQCIEFQSSNLYVGWLIYNTGAPVGTVYRTIDGGATWYAPTGQVGAFNSGMNDLHICDANSIFVVGEAHGGLTYIAKVVSVS